MLRLSGLDELRAVAAGVGAVHCGVTAGRPLLVVDLDGGPSAAPIRTFSGSLALPGCVVAGVCRRGLPERAPDLDLLLTDEPDPPSPWVGCTDLGAALERLASACRRSPLAATTLVELLRVSEVLAVPDGLVAESLAYSTLQAAPEHRAWLAARPPHRRRAIPAPAVRIERSGDLLTVVLDRPEVHNAYDAAMRDGLVEALQLAWLDDGIRRVRLSGAGASFCSGGDLDEFGTAPDPATAHAVRIAAGAARWFDRCADRLEVSVHGACIGAGLELAAFAGRVTSSPDAFYVLPEVGMGLVPGAGGTVSLPRRAARQRVAYLAITGERLAAATAARWGLVDEIAS